MNNTTEIPIDVDHPTIRSYCIGMMLTGVSLPGLIANILVSYVEIIKGLLTSNNSSMYKLSFNLIVADSIHLALIAFYLGPSSALQDWLFPNNWTREIPGRMLIVCWYNMLIDLCTLGVNRYVAVCVPQSYTTLFSNRNTKIVIASTWIGAIVLCVIGEQLLPCCSVYLHYKVYSYSFGDETNYNYNNPILILPLNTFTSVFVLIAYAFVIYNVHVTNKRVAQKIATESQQRRRVKEVRYAFQLIVISSVFISVWILFNVFNHSIPPTEATNGYFSVVIILEIINASANSFVCILFNKEINRPLKKMFCCCCSNSITTVTVTSIKQSAVSGNGNID